MGSEGSGAPIAVPMADDLDRYWAAAARLDTLIDPVGPGDRSLPAIWARAAAKLERARAFLAFLGDPQDRFPIVHVTGTSGKGSTGAAIAAVLSHAGFRTGLATSPFLQVATEKLQIGERLIAPGAFASLVDDVLEAAGRWQRQAPRERSLGYGEIWVALMATWFAREQVDLAVIEVGAGGRFDVTNLVRPLVTVVTSVGLDHTETLGPTVEDIAWHKAGIFKRGAAAVTAAADPVALAVLRREARSLGVSLTEIDPVQSVDVLASDQAGTRWRLVNVAGQPVSSDFHVPRPGRYQAVNGAVAVTAIRLLERHGFRVSTQDLQAGLEAARLPGRAEWMPVLRPPDILLDVAHNPDKVRALVSSLPSVLGGLEAQASPPVLLTGALSNKDARAMMEQLVPLVSTVVTTAVGVTGKEPLSAAAMADAVRLAGFEGAVVAEPEPTQALGTAIRLARERGASVIGTGSLYVAGRLREHWYPARHILRQQTPWPAGTDLVLR